MLAFLFLFYGIRGLLLADWNVHAQDTSIRATVSAHFFFRVVISWRGSVTLEPGLKISGGMNQLRARDQRSGAWCAACEWVRVISLKPDRARNPFGVASPIKYYDEPKSLIAT